MIEGGRRKTEKTGELREMKRGWMVGQFDADRRREGVGISCDSDNIETRIRMVEAEGN